MKIIISIECEKDDEAHEVINLLTSRHKTWVEHREDAPQQAKPKGMISVEVLGANESEPAPPPRKNVSPGGPFITKIGTTTSDMILGLLKNGMTVPEPKYTEHLRLLWSRGLVKFDGKEYYL
jgi:hypothetical protein